MQAYKVAVLCAVAVLAAAAAAVAAYQGGDVGGLFRDPGTGTAGDPGAGAPRASPGQAAPGSVPGPGSGAGAGAGAARPAPGAAAPAPGSGDVADVRTVDVPRDRIYAVFSDAGSWEDVLPDRVTDVSVDERGPGYSIITVTVTEWLISTQMRAEHIKDPPHSHTVRFLDGQFKDSVITQTFEDAGGGATRITTATEIDIGLFGLVVQDPEALVMDRLDFAMDRLSERARHQR